MMNSFMNPSAGNHMTGSRQDPAVRPMRCDMLEFEDRYELALELPGFRKEEIRISLRDSDLTVEAEHTAQENSGKMLRSERYTGPYARSFHIGKNIDSDHADAAYTDGLLRITLRKAPKSGGTIEIQ